MESENATINFIIACKHRLARIQSLLGNSVELKTELEEFDNFLKENWSKIFNELNERTLSNSTKADIEFIFKRIVEIEEITQGRSEWFDDLKKFMQNTVKK